jgi:predicted phosphodiesterase
MRRFSAALGFLLLAASTFGVAGEWYDPAKNNAMQAEGTDDFTFIVLGDSRPDGDQKPDVTHQPKAFHDNIKAINKIKHDFSINVGDLVLGYCERDLMVKEWEMFEKACATLKMPYVTVVGNHDYWNDMSKKLWEERYGVDYFSFDHKECHFIVLNSEVLDKRWLIEGEQLAWLKKDLENAKDSRRIFVFLHGPQWHYKKKEWDRDVHSLLVKYGVDTVFAGHEHRYCLDPERDGVKYVITGGGGAGLDNRPGGFYHFTKVDVSGNSSSFKVVTPDGKELPPDVITDAVYQAVESSISLAPVKEVSKKGAVTVSLRVKNPWPKEITAVVQLDPGPGSWKKKKIKQKIAAGEEATIEIKTNTGGNIMPPPIVKVNIEYGETGAYQRDLRVIIAGGVMGLQSRLVDDFEDGDSSNLCGTNAITSSNGGWQGDGDGLGVTKISYKVEKTKGKDGKQTMALHVTGERGVSTPPSDWAWVTAQTMLSEVTQPNDIRPSVGISFKIRASLDHEIEIQMAGTVGGKQLAGTGATHRYTIKPGKKWQEVKAYWHEFTQPSYICPGEQCVGPLSVDKMETIIWSPREDGKKFNFWLDDVELLYEDKK